jgi:hypothetical protein
MTRVHRDDALDELCRRSVMLIAPEYAAMIASAFDRTLDAIDLAPRPAMQQARDALSPAFPGIASPRAMVRLVGGHERDGAVWTYELAWKLALSHGLYGSRDHATASPYHRPVSEARYIACRAAIRLARKYGGPEAVAALRERNPWLEARLFDEDPFTGTGERLKVDIAHARRLPFSH